ncbi:alpha/beta hydrolase [Flavobacterium agricola]|uniref:Alpha/beta hydrolase n=1 Tax=Flavobacterium agricola TaxID=2870839 RepID=A0ABY6M457_9FLAO|nr:alpha/beta hydrolase [Flavobacterium agricola]UYW02380.1 alpha/beta hydrolase [Flavobacterium agricola]
MQQSFTYYLITTFIKLKGYKKAFSASPINFVKLRDQDKAHPTGNFFKQHITQRFAIENTEITEIKIKKNSSKLILYIHGGAFVFGPTQQHWESVKNIANKTGYAVWLCNYPKAPEYKIHQINANLDAVYKRALQDYEAKNIILLGDSAGGNLILTLTQRIIASQQEAPNKVIAISPVVDAAFTNPEITVVDKKDIMLSINGIKSTKMLIVGDSETDINTYSPILGSFKNFPKLYLFLAEHDITYPDQKILVKKLEAEKCEHYVCFGKNMPHIWPLLPIMKESKVAFNQLIKYLVS